MSTLKNVSVGIINLGIRKEKIKEIKLIRQKDIEIDYPQFPLRLASLISILKASGCDIKVLDLGIRGWIENTYDELKDISSFLSEEYDLILLYQTVHTLSEIQRLSRMLNEVEKKNGIILVCANATKKMASLILKKMKSYLDIVVYGEIELPFLLCNFNLSLEKLKGNPNVMYINAEQIKASRVGYLTEGLMNKLPLPAFEELALKDYVKINTHIPLNLSRGCSFNCKHCAVREVYGKSWRGFRLEKIRIMLERLKELTNKNITCSLMDQDIVFNLDWLEGVCRIFKSSGISWDCKLRPDWLTEEVVNRLSSGNCRNVIVSADVLYDYNPHLAQSLGKIITLDTIKKAFLLCKEKGIKATLAVIPEFYPTTKSILKLVEACEASSVALCPLRVFNTLSEDINILSSNLTEIIDKMKTKGIEISILSGMGEEGW